MPLAKTISRSNSGFPDYLDFNFLLEEGRTHLGKFSGDLWTDHNTHDPGVTILEALIFVLLDLGYRTNTPIKDLLAPDPAGDDNRFFTAKEILGCNPLTIADYRKLLIDIPGVRNAWLEKLEEGEALLYLNCEGETSSLVLEKKEKKQANGVETKEAPGQTPFILNGLYRVWIQPDPVRPQDASKSVCNDEDNLGRILREARARLHGHRNLCEDFAGIHILQEEQIGICAGIEIEPDKNAETVLVEMFLNLDKFISPALPFYSLQDLLKKGKTTEEIFEGRPLLNESHGFIDTEELEAHELPDVLHASDLYRVMLETPGVRAVRNLVLLNYIDGQQQGAGDNWQLCLTKGYFPVLSPELSQVAVFKDGVPVAANFRSIAERFGARLTAAEKSLRRPYELDLLPPDGDFRADRGDYYSIQNEFPLVYGIGEGGLPKDAPKSRRAQALQLKGYLLFFDQLLATYLNQLAQVRDALSVKGRLPHKNGVAPHGLSSVPLLDQLIRGGTPQPEGDDLTGSGRLYQIGDAVIHPFQENAARDCYQNYFFAASPEERDRAIRQVISALEAGDYDVTTVEGDCGYFFQINFRFQMPGSEELFSLRSVEQFSDKIAEEAQRKAKAEAKSLVFLGFQIENFRLVNRPTEGEYSFEIVYQPRRYEDYLAQISAPGDTARQRRKALLDHLLARFGEDFSEYALLTFSADNSDASADELLDDKEHFLTQYDEVSRERGKGFDYTRTEALWDTDNVSGLEQRVAGLMGIDDWKRRTLSPFATVNKIAKTQYKIESYAACQDLWQWETFLPYPSAPDEKEIKKAAFGKLKKAAAQPQNYKLFDCDGYGIYGFALEDENGCTLAQHPDTYGSKTLRDNKIAHFLGLFGPPGKSHCWHVEYPESPEGWFFYLHDKEGKVVLQSAAPAASKEEARITWIFTRNLALDIANYEIVEDPLGRRFSFAVKNEEGEQLAEHPGFYPEKELAEQARDVVQAIFAQQKMDAPLLQRPAVWTWQLTDGAGNVLLQNLFPFETEKQAAFAQADALALAADSANYERTLDTESGEYGFYLTQPVAPDDDEPASAMRIAEHPEKYADPADAETAIAQIVAVAEVEAAFSGKTLPKSNAQRYRLCDADDSLLLSGLEIFPDRASLDAAWPVFLACAASEANYRWEKDEGARVWLEDPNGRIVAEAPSVFADKTAAQAHIARSVYTAGIQRPAPKIETLEKAWSFRLADAAGKAILAGCTWFGTLEEAKAAYLSALFAACVPENWQSKGDKILLSDAEGDIIAISTNSFPDVAQREIMLEAWREWFSGAGIRPRILVCPGEWYFEIKKDGVAVLESVRDYAEQSVAALDLEAAIRAGCEGDYRPTTAEDACRFSFEVTDKEDSRTLASHPFWYDTAEARDEKIVELTAWFCLLKLDVEFRFEEKHYHWELMWETCDERIEPVLVGQNSFASVAEAESDFMAQMKGTKDRLEKTDGNGQFSFQLKSSGGEVVALHPRYYDTATKRDKVLEDLKKYLDTEKWCKITEPPSPSPSPNRQVCDPVEPKTDSGTPQFFWHYRLNKAETVAVFCPQFGSRTERNEYLKKLLGLECAFTDIPAGISHEDICLQFLLDAFACREHEFSSLDFNSGVAKKIGTQYIFQLKTGNQVWWESIEKYGSPPEAFAAFEAQYLEILRLAADSDNYDAVCKDGEACRFELKNHAGEVVARTPHFDPDTVREAYEIRLRHALTYPVFADGGQFGFQLYDFPNRQPLFLSASRYASAADALDAFHHFLELLSHPENLQPLDFENDCRFSFAVQEAGLEGTKHYEDFVDANMPDEPFDHCAWEGLDEMLADFGESVHFYSCFDALAGCRFRLFLAKDSYRVARSCRYFHTAGEREVARDELFQKICCEEIVVPSKPAFCRGFYNGLSTDFPWQPGRGMLISDLMENACYEEILKECNANECFFSAEKLIDLMAFARSLDCYVKVAEPGTGCEPGGGQKIRLGLLGAQNQLIAFGKEVFSSEKEWLDARDEAIRRAWHFPLVRREKGFGFQLATPAIIEGGEVFVEILFESAVVHPSPETANNAYGRFSNLIKNKSNWQRTETDDCGPFGIEIIDPEAILAEHPATYTRRDQLGAAQAELQICLESEGFHALEHILLRPREEGDSVMEPCIPPGQCWRDFVFENEIEEAENYLPGLDPYSFWATVVIPYWSPRFRNLNLRNFFERTLRQEAPAHVALRIAWVDAQQMKDFETAYRLWLETQPQGEASCSRQTALNGLLEILKELVNRYPESQLYSENIAEDTSGAGSYALARLDYTIL